MMREGDYTEGYYLHGFGVRLAEAGAEYVNRLIVAELGSRPAGACATRGATPRSPTTHSTDRVPAAAGKAWRRTLGMDVTEAAGALVPELSTAAIVVHHPEATR
jgi:5-methyltetrahydrofolate--homocysteine methyltransferase